MFKLRSQLAAVLLGLIPVLAFAAVAGANSPWLPTKGSLNTSGSVVYETFDKIYTKNGEIDFPFGDLDQVTAMFGIEYALLEWMSFDVELGYTRTFSEAYELATGIDLGQAGGLTDVSIGLSIQLLDEFDYDRWYVPSISVRGGGIIAGTYTVVNFPANAGDGGTGGIAELALGKVLPYGFGLAATGGIRARDNNIPLEWHLRADAFYTIPKSALPGWLDAVILGFAYDQWRATNGTDLGEPDFDPSQPQELKEIVQNIEASLGVQDSGGRYYSFYYAYTVAGRNTGKKNIFGLSVNLPWQLPWQLPW